MNITFINFFQTNLKATDTNESCSKLRDADAQGLRGCTIWFTGKVALFIKLWLVKEV
jgi:hypothetical protein